MTFPETQTEIITLTPAAIQAFQALLKDRNLPDHCLRVYVASGGCSGIQTGLSLEKNIGEKDLTYEFDGAKVVVDEISAYYLRGTIVDFVDNENGTGFLVNNPNLTSSCGCSSSSTEGCSGETGNDGGCATCG